MAGLGYRIIHGVGQRFIMGVGIITITMAGFGFPTTNGVHHGLPGEPVTAIMAGHQ